MKWYLKERINPQLPKPNYTKLGQMSKRKAEKWLKPLYGENNLLRFDTEEEYNKAIKELEEKGFRIY